MHRIYSQAQRVFIHLGDSTELTRGALDLASHIWMYRELLRQGHPSVTSNKVPLPMNTDVKNYLQGLGELLSRPWFQRMWIVQEAAMGTHRTFMCGSHFFEWPLIEATVYALDWDAFVLQQRFQISNDKLHITNHNLADFFNTLQQTALAVQKNTPMSFVDLLKLSEPFEATDERDKLYALLGLANDAADFPVADYSIPFKRVYHDFALALVRQDRTRYLLNKAGLQNSGPDMPSWIPDWRYPSFASIYDIVSPFKNEPAGNVSAKLFDANEEFLLLLVARLSLVREVAEPFTPPSSPFPQLSAFNSSIDVIAKGLLSLDASKSSTQSPNEDGIDNEALQLRALSVLSTLLTLEGSASWKITGDELRYLMDTLEAKKGDEKHPDAYHPHSTSTRSAFGATTTVQMAMKHYYRSSENPRDATNEAIAPEANGNDSHDDDIKDEDILKPSESQKYWNVASSIFNHRRVFVTENNLVGLAPGITEPGDLVCYINPVPTPYVLRPTSVENGVLFCKLVGDAWVSGIWSDKPTLPAMLVALE